MTAPRDDRHPRSRAISTALPTDSAISDWFGTADLADAFAIPLTGAQAAMGIGHLARCVMDTPPLWLKLLLGIRDAAVSVFGIKSSSELRASAAPEGAGHIDFFRVLSATDREIIVGENDRHLDFRASVKLRKTADGADELIATTAVRCHNPLGRLYLRLITPFHKFIVLSNLNRAAERGWAVSESPM